MSEGFADFYSAHYQQIAAQLHAYLGDEGEAQDVTQEAFCRALDRWKRISAYQQPSAWVRQVAWNLATSRLRHLRVVTRHAARQRPSHMEGPSPDRVVIVNALAALPANHRLAVVLHHIGDLSTSEIAQQRGVAEGTVRSWLSRGRSQLAEELSEWRPRFSPPGVEAAKATVRRRRVARRSALAGLILLVAIGFAAVVLRGGGGNDRNEIIEPTPSPSVDVTRRLSLPGVDIPGSPAYTRFIDGRHAWVMFRSCKDGNPPCRYALGVTEDTGATWRRIALPAEPADGTLDMNAYDAQTVILSYKRGPDFRPEPPDFAGSWLSRDGGASFQWYPADAVPSLDATLRGGFEVRCAPGKPEPDCGRRSIVDNSTGKEVFPLPSSHPMPVLVNGADGRLWLQIAQGEETRLSVSVDHGRTWRDLSWPRGGKRMQVSPDGRDAWVQGSGAGGMVFWEFDGTTWRQRMTVDVDAERFQPLLLNGGVWVVKRGQKLFYLKGGALTEIPGIANAMHGQVLRDGSVVIYAAEIYVGVGQETDRTWIQVHQ